jgi:hypothetical protein
MCLRSFAIGRCMCKAQCDEETLSEGSRKAEWGVQTPRLTFPYSVTVDSSTALTLILSVNGVLLVFQPDILGQGQRHGWVCL